MTFLGYVPAGRTFVRGRCLVVSSRAESFPYVVLEAAAIKLPMILPDVGGLPEIALGSQMELVKPGSLEELTKQMAAFLDDPMPFIGKAEELGRIVAERYTVRKMARAITDFYADVLTQPGSGN